MQPQALAPGAVFAGDFVVERQLRTGGMGAVYVALQKSTGRRRALKLMLPQLVDRADLRRRFEREARIASLIASEHVVEVVGAGIDAATGAPWLAMELLEGEDLDAYVASHGPLRLDEARVILQEICHAVGAAHGAGIIHRDLKPENVFVARSQRSGGASIVKVLDFGIARLTFEASTQHTQAMGSPMWMAPEQSERGKVTCAADVWAVGLIAFFLLVGRVFWLSANDEGTVPQIMREVLLDPIPSARERAMRYGGDRLLPAWFDAWFARCVDRDPARRYPTARDAWGAFLRLERGGPSVSPPGGAEPGARAAGRPASVATAPTELALSSVTPAARSSSTALANTVEAPTPAPPTPAPRPRPVRPLVLVLGAGALVASGLAFRALDAPPSSSPPVESHHAGPTLELPPQLASTPAAAWFLRVRARCNPIEVELLLQQDRPPSGKDGVGFAAACLTLAGKLDRARARIDALPAADRTWAAWPVFEVVHPIADAGDDASTGPAMRLVLEYWPQNYMALYHAGIAEYATGDVETSRAHLQKFLRLYDKRDGFAQAAQRTLDALAKGPASDCSRPVDVDPEGRRIYPPGCPKPPR